MQGFAEGGLVVTVESGIVALRFERPERLNAIDVPMAQAFNKAAAAIAADPSARVVVLSGAGRAFMAGGGLAPVGHGGAGGGAIIHPLEARLAPRARLQVAWSRP